MIRISLRSPRVPRPTDADAQRIQDILWAHLRTNSIIEHIHGRAGPDRIDLSLFIRGNNASPAVTDGTVADEVNQCLLALPEWTADGGQGWSE